MTQDPLDALKSALQGLPGPDSETKARHIARAEENFAQFQENRDQARLTSDRPALSGFLRGVKTMLNLLTTRGALTATTSLAALGLVAFVILPSTGLDRNWQAGDATAPTPASVEQTTNDDRASIVANTGSEIAASQPERKVENEAKSLSDAASEGDLMMAEPMVAEEMAEAFAAAPIETRNRAAGLSSSSADFAAQFDTPVVRPEINAETFANAAPNQLKVTADEPVSTFSIDVDTASYAIVRSSLMNGYLPNPDAVRVEEMVNYFDYNDPAPDGDHPFATSVSVSQTPWNSDTQLVRIGIQGEMPAIEDRPALNLVFLIDTSGSMQDANKLPLLIQSFRLMLGELRAEDRVAIVTYAGSAGQVLAPTPASDRDTIMAALGRLSAGGSTAGQAGLQQAYQVADQMTENGGLSRVILATDGDFNVGIHDPDHLKEFISAKRDSGTYLSVLGFGRGNLDDKTMQALAQNGNGQAAYIDTLTEAQKVLVDQLTGALYPIANDVKIQVEFNPAAVAEYRLIGYETRALRREDFNNDKIDAGEIGAGHSVTALYEVTPTGSDAVLNDPLRYGETLLNGDAAEIGYLKLRYKQPGKDRSTLIESPIPIGIVAADRETRFAAAIAGFGQLLRGSDYLGSWGYADAIALATNAKGDDKFGYRQEAINLMRLAQSLSN